ncbi:MAG: sulfotransferase-like domain-containing protein [bacterium]
MTSTPQVLLTAGLQSGGSTLVSWCFLQRPDCNGVLDGDTDLVPQVLPNGQEQLYWYKTTISCFSLPELVALVEDQGYPVKPVLIVRDVRLTWESLARKHYGRNGITAEDPPLRLRFRRFLDSWRYARSHGVPILKFEDFLSQPEATLQRLCADLGIDWDDAMIHWPKDADAVTNIRHGNATFRESSKADVFSAIGSGNPEHRLQQIHEQDLDWLEKTFDAFNVEMGYPARLQPDTTLPGRAEPGWDVSRRKKWRLQQRPVRYLLSKLGLTRYQPRPE